MRSDLEKLDSLTLETSKNHLIRNFLCNGIQFNFNLIIWLNLSKELYRLSKIHPLIKILWKNSLNFLDTNIDFKPQPSASI